MVIVPEDASAEHLGLVDCFAGAGGLSLGLMSAGFRPYFAFDADPLACETYRLNIGSHIAVALAAEVSPERVRDTAGLLSHRPALVCGGPPCQGFSVQRRGSPYDPRNDLVIQFIRFAVALRPRAVLLENVPGLLGRRGHREFRAVVKLLTEHGYDHTATVLDAASYGVPQHRLRAFLVAWDPQECAPFAFPPPTHGPGGWITVRDAIGDLPEPPADFSPHPDYSNHVRVRISPLNLERIAHVPPGGGRADLPPHLQLACHKKDDGHRHLDVYGRMEWDKPAPTITAMFDNFTRGRFAHPVEDRSITGREGARLQSFPDWFRFHGPKKDVARQIGNAVPPRLAQALGQALMTSFRGEPADGVSKDQLLLPLSHT